MKQQTLQTTMGYGLPLTDEQYNTLIHPIITENQNKNIFKTYIDYITAKYSKKTQPENDDEDFDAFMNTPVDFYIAKHINNRKELEKLNIENFIIRIKNPQITVENDENNPTEAENVIILIPPIQALKWHRQDDQIDTISHYLQHGNKNKLQPTITKLKYSPYPYNGNVMNKNTGELHVNRQYEAHLNAYKTAKGTPEETKHKNFWDKHFQTNYKTTVEEAEQNLTVSAVPQEIQDFAEAIKLTPIGVNFTHKLKPYLATH